MPQLYCVVKDAGGCFTRCVRTVRRRCLTTLGIINVMRGIWMRDPVDWKVIAVGAAEAMVPLTLAFGALTFAWLCVAWGMRRNSQ